MKCLKMNFRASDRWIVSGESAIEIITEEVDEDVLEFFCKSREEPYLRVFLASDSTESFAPPLGRLSAILPVADFNIENGIKDAEIIFEDIGRSITPSLSTTSPLSTLSNHSVIREEASPESDQTGDCVSAQVLVPAVKEHNPKTPAFENENKQSVSVTPAENPESDRVNNSDQSEWSKVQYENKNHNTRRKQSGIVGTNSTTDPETQLVFLKLYVQQFFPEAESSVLTAKYPGHYSSFKVCVNSTSEAKALNPAIWPAEAYIPRFLHRKKEISTNG
ncbi:hypothetical protein JTB14_005501 [Gonioctena quinquepunctata]|nr:hypothetical protein JTB14_005501 [Gonioctena quinquepunctata]